MKNYSSTVILFLLLINSSSIKAQEEGGYKNRIYTGFGGEDGYLGVDYIEHSSFF